MVVKKLANSCSRIRHRHLKSHNTRHCMSWNVKAWKQSFAGVRGVQGLRKCKSLTLAELLGRNERLQRLADVGTVVSLQLFVGPGWRLTSSLTWAPQRCLESLFFSCSAARAQWGQGRALSNCLTCTNNMEPWQGERALGAPYPLHPGPFNPLHSHPLHTSSSTVCLGATGMLGDPPPPSPHPASYCSMGLWENGLDFTLSAILSSSFPFPPPPFLEIGSAVLQQWQDMVLGQHKRSMRNCIRRIPEPSPSPDTHKHN